MDGHHQRIRQDARPPDRPGSRGRMLGPAVYEVRFGFSTSLDQLSLPNNLQISARGENWLRYRSSQPESDNPLILQYLLNQGLKVVGLKEVPRSLEQIYLQVMNEPQAIHLETTEDG